VPYSQQLTPSGTLSACTYAVTAGTLPPGITLSAAGLLSGTPTSINTYNFTVTATDAAGCTSVHAYALQVVCPTITLAPVTLPVAQKGVPYNATVVASPPGTYTYAVTSGSLPAGLNLNASTGAITGTPTVDGSFSFTITATDAAGCTGFRAYTMAAYSTSFYDDNKRSQFCVNTATGAYQWSILKGPGSVNTYTGTLQVMNGGTLFVLSQGPSQPNAVYLVYDVNNHTANGYFYHGTIYSPLADKNTKNDPACGP
jgi:hypothetical protein